MKKTLFAALTLSTVFTASVSAAPYGYYPGHGAYAPQVPVVQSPTPEQILRQGIDLMRGYLDRGVASEAELKAFLDREISPYFDFAYMAQWAAGPMMRGMNPQQKAQFAEQLKDMFFSSLARNLGAYSSPAPRIDVSPAHARPYSKEVTVKARVTPQTNGYPVMLQFRFYRSTTGWKVFDVTANGASAVAYYRKYFNSMGRRPMGR